MKLHKGDIVDYDNGVFSGTGKVVGCAMVEQPVIGATWILQDMSANVPNDTYEFDTFICHGCHITK